MLILGDALTEIKKLPANHIDLIVLDPPYLTTKQSWDKKEVVSLELSQELFRVLKLTGNLYVWCGIGEKSQSLIRWFPIFSQHFHFKDLITWKKQRGIGMRKGWLYTREEIMWFVKDNKNFVWNKNEQYSQVERPWHVFKKGGKMVNKSKFKRWTNVWTDINEVGFGTSPKRFKEIRKELTGTPKPVKAIERIITLHTQTNDLVLDCFGGSGTTGIACKNLNRKFILIENNLKIFTIMQTRLNNNL